MPEGVSIQEERREWERHAATLPLAAGMTQREEPIAGLPCLWVAHAANTFFTLVSFARNRHVTLGIEKASVAERAFGDVRGTYLVVPAGHGCRLLVKLRVNHPRGVVGRVARHLLPWGDLVMMRRQLLNLKRLAEGAA